MLSGTPHDVAGSGYLQIDVPELAGKSRARYAYSSAGEMSLELSTLLTGKLADIFLRNDSVVVNDYVQQQSFVDGLENLAIPGIGRLRLGSWDLKTVFLGIVELQKSDWEYRAAPTPHLFRPNEEVLIDQQGRLKAWSVRDADEGALLRELELEYETDDALFPVSVTVSDYEMNRKLKLTHKKVVWDDPYFQVTAIDPTFPQPFKFSTLQDK
ncbi:MAG: DUF4292 domain-containing protein [Candidatus Marinimicrobia bacterium]|nr:DUF4292 domain-containing protein [Candidatus Neomarinimicrobiota bacterium]